MRELLKNCIWNKANRNTTYHGVEVYNERTALLMLQLTNVAISFLETQYITVILQIYRKRSDYNRVLLWMSLSTCRNTSNICRVFFGRNVWTPFLICTFLCFKISSVTNSFIMVHVCNHNSWLLIRCFCWRSVNFLLSKILYGNKQHLSWNLNIVHSVKGI